MFHDALFAALLVRAALPIVAAVLIGFGFVIGRWGGAGGIFIVTAIAIAAVAYWWRHR